MAAPRWAGYTRNQKQEDPLKAPGTGRPAHPCLVKTRYKQTPRRSTRADARASSHKVFEVRLAEELEEARILEEGDMRRAADGGVELLRKTQRGRRAEAHVDVPHAALGERREQVVHL